MGPQVQNMFVWLAEQLRRFVSPQVFCSVALLVSAAKMGKKLTPAQKLDKAAEAEHKSTKWKYEVCGFP